MSDTQRVLDDIEAERVRQDERFGEQNHHTWAPGQGGTLTYEVLSEELKKLNAALVEQQNANGVAPDRNCFWDTILCEEVYEALAEADPQKRRTELVQAAAVIVAMIEHIDRVREPLIIDIPESVLQGEI